MTAAELELAVRDLVEQVAKGRLPEDDYVELKADWIDPRKAARRLAAHANTARGEPILWLVGLGEKTGPTNAEQREPSEWLSQMKKYFDGPSPQLIRHRIVSFDSGSVTALHFATDEGPYVVTAGVSDKTEGAFQREVPWRDGAGTRSCHRADLLRLLVPVQRLPELEVVGGRVQIWRDQQTPLYRLELAVFVTPWRLEPICFPTHRVSAQIEIPEVIALEDEFELDAEDSETRSLGPAQVTLGGAGVVIVSCAGTGPEIASEATLVVQASMRPANSNVSGIARARMTPRRSKIMSPSDWWAFDSRSGFLDGVPDQERKW